MQRRKWLGGAAGVCAGAGMILIVGWWAGGETQADFWGRTPPTHVAPPDDHGQQFERAQIRTLDTETDNVLRVVTARSQFNVDGTGLAVAVLDTGLRTTHVDFAGKVVAQRNFTTDDGGAANTVTDGNGHGTNVAGITVANGIHTGIAPGAKVVPLKVLSNSGGGSFAWVASALDWVAANAATYNISVLNLSLGDGGNYTGDNFAGDSIRAKIQSLRSQRIAVCVAAGNSFFSYNSAQGMGYPAIFRESISVGALYDADIGAVSYGSGASAYSTGPLRFAPFSQRLHPTLNAATRTDIFVPGAALTSAGNANDTAESTYHGTSQATPVVSGLVLLCQQYVKGRTGQLPTVDQLEAWLRAVTSRTTRTDGDDESDNVANTGLQFQVADAVDFLTAAKNELDSAAPPPPPPPPPGSGITASYSASTNTLTLTGDAVSNYLSVSRSGTTIKVQGSSGTQINGQNYVNYTVTNTSTFKITATLNGGSDQISLTSIPASSVSLYLNDGNDKVTISYCTISALTVSGGTGTDTLVTTSSTISKRTLSSVP